MSYGICSTDTRAWIERRAAQTGTDMRLVDLESEADNALEISITFGGALDEVFSVSGDYAETVFEWVCELMWDTYPRDFWEVELCRILGDDTLERIDYAANEEK